MSFSSEVKEELSRQLSPARHCRIAELAALLNVCGQVEISEDDSCAVILHTENISVARKYFTLLKKTFNIEAVIRVRKNACLKKSNVYLAEVTSHSDTVRILQAVKLMTGDQELVENQGTADPLVIQSSCCRRA